MRLAIRAALAVTILLAGSARVAYADQCAISATALAFGGYNVFTSRPTDSTATLTYECNGGGKAPIAIALVPSQPAAPALRNGTDRLFYGLFQDAARTRVWGAGAQMFFGERSKQPTTVPVFGRIPPRQDVSVGVYGDTVVAVVNF